MSNREVWTLAGHEVPDEGGPCRLCGCDGAARLLGCPKRCDHCWTPELNETGDRVMAEACDKCGVQRDIASGEGKQT